MDKQKWIYNGIALDHKKGWRADICYNVDEPKHYIKWQKPDIEGHNVVVHIYEIPHIVKSVETESRLLFSKRKRMGGWSKTAYWV